MGYAKKKIEAQKTQSHGVAMQSAQDVPRLIKGIPFPTIVDGKIENVAEYIKQVLTVIREYLLVRYGLGSDVHETAVARFVNALQRWHIARDALERDGDYIQGNSTLVAHPAHRVIQMAERTMSQFEMDFGLLPRQSFTRAEASSAGGSEAKENDIWISAMSNIKDKRSSLAQ